MFNKGLWGDDFEIEPTIETSKKIVNKIKNQPIKDISEEKLLKSKKLTISERLNIITKKVNDVLSSQRNFTKIIKTKEELKEYIDKAIASGFMAIDTETNNTLDYLNCKIMGACLYVAKEKQVYVPINHVDVITNERLSWQLTEKDLKEEFKRLIDNNVKLIFHNYKFDYQVIYCTCKIKLPCYWDTMVSSKLIDENEKAGLKQQYIDKINPAQEKYDIESLFEADVVQYAWVDPEIFALYSATDAMMTFKLYEYQKAILEKPDYSKIYDIFRNIEMPIVEVVAKMEMRGILIDQDYAKRLSIKYHKLQEQAVSKVQEELTKLQPQIEAWKQTKEAQVLEGKKMKKDLLSEPINIQSPKQLAILIFDILKYPQGLGATVNDTPRGTGENVLTTLAEKYNFTLGKLIIEQKKIDKLLNAFIDTLPNSVNPKDQKIHCHFLPMGAKARFSCTNPNVQQIPSNIKDIRPMFTADIEHIEYIEDNDNILSLDLYDSIKTLNGYVKAKELTNNDIIITSDTVQYNIKDIHKEDDKVIITLEV